MRQQQFSLARESYGGNGEYTVRTHVVWPLIAVEVRVRGILFSNFLIFLRTLTELITFHYFQPINS